MIIQGSKHAFGLLLGLLLLAAPTSQVRGERTYLHEPLAHLRSGSGREWASFPERAEGNRLDVEFQSHSNDGPWTLGIRRIDVKEGWQATLNGRRLGRLFSDENDMHEVWEVPAGSIQEGANRFSIEATSERSDDVRIGAVWLDKRPRSTVLGEASLELSAIDNNKSAIPCRFTILDKNGSLAATGTQSSERLAVRSGVVYSLDGKVQVGLAPGKYTVLCGRGFEYSLARRQINVEPGENIKLQFAIRRVVDTKGLVACDTHVHTFEVSRHGDASLSERMVTLAGEGVEVAIATDHNVHVDYRPYLKRQGADRYVTPIIGNEVTTKFGHFNVFPATKTAKPSDHKAPSWDELFRSIFATPNVKVAILNHPRDVHSGFTPFAPQNMVDATGKRLDNRELQANGMELINSAALQSDPMPALHNWMTLLNRGHRIAAVGSSDSHEVSRKIVGQGRSYVAAPDTAPGQIDAATVVQRFVNGQVLTSLGLLTQIKVNDAARSGDLLDISSGDSSEKLVVRVRVQGPEWTTADQVLLYMNGERVREQAIPETLRTKAGEKYVARWTLDRPPHDVHLVAVATGPGVTGLYWPIAKAYQPTSNVWRPYVFGASGVVRVDVDGNGFQSARDYAAKLSAKHATLPNLLNALQAYDGAVGVFSAEAWRDNGGSPESPESLAALAKAPENVREAFERYDRSLRRSLRAQAEREPPR